MIRIGLVRESKTPTDNRVAFSPRQCRELQDQYPEISFRIQPSPIRCFRDEEYVQEGLQLSEDLSDCDILFGVKEPLISSLIPEKTYLFFSHTKKAQPHNQKLMRTLMEQKIRMIDYECLTFDDGHRVLGFGFWAGVVGAHNGLLAYGKRSGAFQLNHVYQYANFQELKYSYEGFTLPPIKIVLTGSGRVSAGVLDILNYLDIDEVSPHDFLTQDFVYPVFTHLKGASLYQRKDDGTYNRKDFHEHPEQYRCTFLPYAQKADILMNGVYWDKTIPRLFELDDLRNSEFKLQTIADITCDEGGSVPCNLGSTTIDHPTYGFDKKTGQRCTPFLNQANTLDIMAVDNLPNELPRDASTYFGGHLQTHIMSDLISGINSEMLTRATICDAGKLGKHFQYLHNYALG